MMSLPLDLTAMEVMLLTDRIQNTDLDDGRAIAKRFLLKLGSAYLDMVSDSAKSGTCAIHVTQPEAWLARSKFNSGDRCDADAKLGIHVLRKLYSVLLAFDTADQTGALTEADSGDLTFKAATDAAEDRRFWPFGTEDLPDGAGVH